ncbi:MAG: MBL fold metallo-hydrolase [Erysipelotrichaceae bacterium]|nr:MBL fold metallo-hydrolase [Erysipelotrichaceae bacterium]
MYIVKKNNSGEWIIIKEGGKRATKVFDTKAEAVFYAKEHYPDDYEVESEVQLGEKSIKFKAKGKVFIALIAILVLAIIVIGILIATGHIKLPSGNDSKDTPTNNAADHVEGVVYDDFQMHFLELGNEYTGDSTYIKAGDVDILIDAGSRKNSAVAIKEYVDKYCTDGKLEYVIATHAHQDHIAGFVGSKSGSTRTGIFYQYEIDVLIDFALTEVTSALYTEEYVAGVDYLVSNGTKHYKANECWDEINGAKKQYAITDNVTMDILYNKYYFEDASDENDYSVCTLFTYNENEDTHRFLLTGDLEKHGEAAMAEYYKTNGGLEHCDLFKAGHHGSVSSSNDALLELITPDVCTVCCCAGNQEYTSNNNNDFPTQEFIDRIAKYTDAVYVTSVYDESEDTFKSFNGTIIVSCKGAELAVACSNNNIKLKDSDWFNETIYVDSKGNYSTEADGGTAVKRRIWPS